MKCGPYTDDKGVYHSECAGAEAVRAGYLSHLNKVRGLMEKLKRSSDPNIHCWCEVAIGHPLATDHSATCKSLQAYWAAYMV